jgi:HEAT repeat protein
VNDVLHPAESLHGGLQRGRGCAARRAARAPGAGELVNDCVRGDPRWDALEARGLYYARLILDLELDTAQVAGHLREEDPADLAVDVLANLVRLGRADAAAPLRRYAREGGNWYTALQALVELDDPDLADGLDEVAAARCDDDELARLCEGTVTRDWAARHPRIAAARRPDVRPHEPRPTLTGRGDDDLAACARGRGSAATAAILELGRRRSPLVLDLVEELLPEYEGPLCRAVRDLGVGALARARSWARHSYRDLGIDVLAAHGGDPDVPLLLDVLGAALGDEDWDLAAVPAEGLGRLRCRPAIPPLMRGWAESASSRLRMTVLAALLEIDPHVAEPYLVEGLWDCEDGVRRIAAGAVPLGRETEPRLRRLRDEAAEDPHVRSAAQARLSAPR